MTFRWLLICTGIWMLAGGSGLRAQIQDNFADGDLTNNPTWTGDVARFQVVSGELQSNGNPANDTLYLSTPVILTGAAEWQITARYAFAPSTSNFIRIYLSADNPDLTGPLNGYYLQAGETGNLDSYDLYRQDGSTHTRLIDGTDGLAATTIDATLRVVRDGAGNWQLSVDQGNTGSFVFQGNVLDNTYPVSAHAGIWLKHSATRNTSFFFDNIYAGPPIVDTEPPALVSVTALTATQLHVLFSEALDPATAQNPSHYSVSPSISLPQAAVLDQANPRLVLLTLGTPLINQTTYTLAVSQVKDLAGNVPTQLLIGTFTYLVPATATWGDVVINEIMADPTPVVGLPDAEYLELHNRTSETFDLAGWTLTNGTTTATLPAYLLPPGGYLILCATALTGGFQPFGPVLGLSPMPALTNGGDNLSLKSATGTPVDSVIYTISWYGDPDRDDGGYALERINPNPTGCGPRSNWKASVAEAGGTPGTVNSVFSTAIPTTPPELVSASITGADQIEVCFSTSMDAALATDNLRYQLSPGGSPPLTAMLLDADAACVRLTFGGPLAGGVIYTLSFSGLEDCNGNALDPATTATLAIGEPPAPFDLIINEIFPDPSPVVGLPEAEFVELYNRSGQVLDLTELILTDGTTEAVLSGQLLPEAHLIVCADDYIADFAGLGTVLGVSAMPSLNNTGDSLYLLDEAGTLMDYVFYQDTWYANEQRQDGGYTLERVDPGFVDCNNAGNWRASADALGGTPGRVNSVRGTFSDTEKPTLESLALLDAATLELRFSEPMDPASILDLGKYAVTPLLGQPLDASPGSADNRIVRLTFLPADTNQIYLLAVTGLADCSGNTLTETYEFGIPVTASPGDILLNEILFNPYTGGYDFVELYNASNKVLDLRQVRTGKIFPDTDSAYNIREVSESIRLFLPGQLICLSENTVYQQVTYLPPGDARFLEVDDLPSYDDSKGGCVILSESGAVLDRFDYLDDYQFPTLADKNGVSLERISLRRPAQDPTNWHSAASTVRYATPGYPNSQAQPVSDSASAVTLAEDIFSPNGDGDADVLVINYQFDYPANVRVSVLDSRGRLIRLLSQNILTGTEPGSFFWDGADDQTSKADIGPYIILVEALNQQTGVRQVYRLVAVLADRF
ncbi:MAG: lamin tail domain-containing protein [Bacteroidia bacterium]|nr:lamin tail domain-containing protein [Bacteroidia bacterium]